MKAVVVGAGKLGMAVAEALLGGGNEVTLIDKDEERIQVASDQFDAFTICADAKRTDVLRSLPISEHNLLVAVTSNDEVNILIASFAKKLGCQNVIARVREPEHVGQFRFIMESMGIDHILNPDLACAREIKKYLTETYAFSGGRFDIDNTSILEFEIEKMPGLCNKAVKEAAASLPGLLIAAVSREGKIMIPKGNTELLAGDVLYVIGTNESINAIASKVSGSAEKTKVSRVMIAGGGKTGFYLAKLLSDEGIGVKIIERNKERCEYLSAALDNVLVLNADATDTAILTEENLDSMDAFICVTGFDEENLLLSLVAKRAGVEEIVAKLSRKSYAPLTENLGVAMTINPMDMSASDVLHFIRKDGVVLFNQLINGQAEFKEILATLDMPMTNKTLSELVIPDGIIIATIHRGKDVIIPRGNTKILPGDRVVMLSLLSAATSLEGLLNSTKSHSL